MISIIIREPENDPKELQLESGRTYSLGRNMENDISLADYTVSRRHAELIISNDSGISIEDLNSTAGIYINKKKIKNRVNLHHGDIFLIRKTSIKIDTTALLGNETKSISNKELKELLYHGNNKITTNHRGNVKKTENQNNSTIRNYRGYPCFRKLLVKTGMVSFNDEYVLDQPEIKIGRSKECHIRVYDKLVSNHHLFLNNGEDSCILTDLNSKNGTRLNGQRIYQVQSLQDGDVIEIGNTIFQFISKNPVVSNIHFAVPGISNPSGLNYTDSHYNSSNHSLSNIDVTHEKGRFATTFAVGMISLFIFILGTFFAPRFTKAYKSNKRTVEATFASVSSPVIPSESPFTADIKKAEPEKMTAQTNNVQPKTQDNNGKFLLEQGLELYIKGEPESAINRLHVVSELTLPSENPLKTKAMSLIESIKAVKILYQSGVHEYNNKEFSASIETLRKVLEKDKEIVGNQNSHYSNQSFIYIVNSYYYIAKTAFNESDYTKSREYCSKTLKLIPEHEGAIEIERRLAEITTQ